MQHQGYKALTLAIAILSFSGAVEADESAMPLALLKSKTPEVIDTIQDWGGIRATADNLSRLEKNPLTNSLASTNKLHQQLSAEYKSLSDAETMFKSPGELLVPAHSRARVRVYYYFIEGTLGGAHPTMNSYYAWYAQSKFDIPYYSALMKFASQLESKDLRIYDLVYRIFMNNAFNAFNPQPDEQKILLGIDPQAKANLVTRNNPPAPGLLKVLPRPVVSRENAQTIEGVSLYADTVTYDQQQIIATTFYNPGDVPVLIDVSTFLLRSDGPADIDLAVTLQHGPTSHLVETVNYLKTKLNIP